MKPIAYSYQIHRVIPDSIMALDQVFSREQARDLARLDRQRLRSNNLIEFPVEYRIENLASNRVVESVWLS